MSAYVLLDVSQKQEFIFKSNDLKDNLYNSAIIKVVTEIVDSDALNGAPSVNLTNHLKDYCHKTFSGGGNSIIKFKSEEQAVTFIRDYSLSVLRAYPDLELYMSIVTHEELGDETEFSDIRKKLHKKLDQIKDKRRSRFRRWTFGIEKVNKIGKGEETASETPNYEWARKLLSDRLSQGVNKHVKLTNQLQDFKKTEEKSYIGVLSIDGNRMGEMVQDLKTFEEHKSFSQEIDSIYAEAVVDALNAHSTNGDLSITPLVLAGDDICLIVPAEHAISMMNHIIQHLHEHKIGNWNLQACGGAAIVKVTYPFYDAFKKAEALCKKAKEAIYRAPDTSTSSASFIDWEIFQGQVMNDRDYEEYLAGGQNDKFHIKPLRIDQDEPYKNGVFSYGAFEEIITHLKIATEPSTLSENDSTISQSSLEQLKKHFYYGWNEYEHFFAKKQVEDVKRLLDIVNTALKVETTHGAIIEGETHTFVLNDIIEALPFFANKKEELTHGSELVQN